MDRILDMILRRLVNKGINSGIKAATNRGKGANDQTREQRDLNR